MEETQKTGYQHVIARELDMVPILVSLLTPKRVKNYCIVLICVNALMIGLGFARTQGLTLSGAPFGGDFVAFHNSGRILTDYGPHRLYDFQLQDDLTHEFLPGLSVPFVNPPFVAILFSPLAHLPLWLAYLIWMLVSISLYAGMIRLGLQLQTLPSGMTFLICLAFPPFFMVLLAAGQISAIGTFVFALWLYLMKTERKFIAGAVLGFLLYKPTLAILLVPALLFGRQFRTLIGFAAISTLLVLLSIWMLSPAGLIRYVAILREYSSLVGSGYIRPAMHVDLAAFVRQLFHTDIRYLSILLALPLTYLTRENPERAIVPTMVFNSYAPVYDLVVLVPLLLFTHRFVSRQLLAVLFVASFFTVPICQFTGLQIITPVLVVLCYVLCVKPLPQLNPLRHAHGPLGSRIPNEESASERA